MVRVLQEAGRGGVPTLLPAVQACRTFCHQTMLSAEHALMRRVGLLVVSFIKCTVKSQEAHEGAFASGLQGC